MKLNTLAIIAAVEDFQFYFYETPFEIVTDHKACISHLRAIFDRV